MNTRKILAVLFALVLLVGMTACNRNRNNNVSSLPGGTPGTAGAGTELSTPAIDGSKVEVDDTTGRYEFSDEHVSIDLNLDRKEYTVSDLVDLNVTIHNNAQTPIAFVSGSGSNMVPDGLNVTLGGLTPMYRPVVTTSDMQYSNLAPGESVTFNLPFAPYLGVTEGLVGPGTDQTLDYFRDNKDYTPVPTGTVNGTLTFTYQLMEDESFEGPYVDLMEGGTPRIITGEFTANVIEATGTGNSAVVSEPAAVVSK